MANKKQQLFIFATCFLILSSPLQAGNYWIAKAQWAFGATGRVKTYEGRAPTRELALAEAKRQCFIRQFLGIGASYCRLDPQRVEYKELRDCGPAWSDWKEVWQGIGNPCPSECFRGNTLAAETRMGGVPVRPQHRELDQCWAYK